MATIKSQLVLMDRMTGPLKNITTAMNIVLNSFEAMQNKSRQAIDTKAIQAARDELAKASVTLDELEKRVENVNQKAEKTEDAFSRVAKAVGLAVAARKAVDVIKTGIDYASDLAEVQNVVDVTFGSSASSINSWSKDCLAAYGMNEVSAKRYAGTIGAMLKSSGVAGDAVTGMSQDMVGLAGDMASFYNLDLGKAFEKIRSGISGETEPLKALGINMSVANLEAFALSQGIEKSYSEMSQAEQVMLRYNYLMVATADAQGDFARTQDSYANQTRLLSESWLQFTGIMAEQLLPILTEVVSWLNSIVAFLTENADMVSAVLVGLAATVGILAAAWGVHAAAQWLAVAANRALVASLLTNPLLWIALIIGIVVAAMYKWVKSIGGVRIAWEICKAALMVAWNGLRVAWYAVVFGVVWGVNKILDFVDFMKLSWKTAGLMIANFMGSMKVSVLTILQNLINGAIDIINGFIGLLNKIPGVNIDLVEHVTFATTAAAEEEAAKQARAEDFKAYQADIEAGKAARAENLAKAKSNLDNAVADVAASKDELVRLVNESKANAADSGAEDIADNTSEIAGNTANIADSVQASSEDLKHLRDVAEREAINRFTTAEIRVEQHNENHIASDMDIDGIMDAFANGFAERLDISAEGVHI